MFIVFLFTLIFTVFTACSYNWGFFCSYLHWYSLYLLLATIICLFILFLFTLIFTVFTACNYLHYIHTACSYEVSFYLCSYLHWYSLYLLLVTIIYCSYLHWYSLYLLLATIIYVYCVPIYIDIHCIYCL